MTDDEWSFETDPLMVFLAGRHAEEEAAAKAAGGHLDSGGPGELMEDLDHFRWRGQPLASASIAHIALHDPHRALREIEAARAIMSAYERSIRAIGVGLSKDIRQMLIARAAIWQEHPGYAAAVA